MLFLLLCFWCCLLLRHEKFEPFSVSNTLVAVKTWDFNETFSNILRALCRVEHECTGRQFGEHEALNAQMLSGLQEIIYSLKLLC